MMTAVLMSEGCDDIFDDNKVVTVCEKTLPTLIQTNETYESTQIDAFLKIDANAQRQEYKMAS